MAKIDRTTLRAEPLEEASAGSAPGPTPEGEPLLAPDSPLFQEVKVVLEARLGEATLPLAELLALRKGGLLPLDRQLNEPVELFLNGALVARGEIVTVGDNFGIRVDEVAVR